MTPFVAMAQATQRSLERYTTAPAPADPRAALTTYVRTRTWNDEVVPALAAITGSDRRSDQERAAAFAQVPAEAVSNVRNDMYLTLGGDAPACQGSARQRP